MEFNIYDLRDGCVKTAGHLDTELKATIGTKVLEQRADHQSVLVALACLIHAARTIIQNNISAAPQSQACPMPFDIQTTSRDTVLGQAASFFQELEGKIGKDLPEWTHNHLQMLEILRDLICACRKLVVYHFQERVAPELESA